MTLLQAILLGILQGITEFLPISSSGHLILAEWFFGLSVSELKSFDVVVHMGTLLAIFIYFWRDFLGIILGIFGKTLKPQISPSEQLLRKFVGSRVNEDAASYRFLLLCLVIGTIPAVIVGVFLGDWIDSVFRHPLPVVLAMIFVGLVFFLVEIRFFKKNRSDVRLWDAVFIGIFQAVAITPGISRSGSTIASGLFRGLKREAAARFSFLLGAPAILGAGIWTAFQVYNEGGLNLGFDLLAFGFLSAAISGLLTVRFLMRFLKTHSLRVFGFYLLFVGILSLYFFYQSA